ncbi:ribonuclease H [Senna tora]|uniref:Ribonuclease H n=1 Tax=Senna tora TaxID=362788 RepID=A0A835CL47_9FABA|nr:ribonuclease H [Senna tora]
MLMECVTTTSMKVKIDRELTDWFTPSVGLRQRDPLSPYLYVLYANVLSHFLMNAQDNNKIRGIKIARAAPRINYLMYADDILLFLRDDKKNCENIKFSPNVSSEGKQSLTRIVHCQQVDHLRKYLGGFIDGPNTARSNTSMILDNMQQRLAGWKYQLLYQAARTTLIKAMKKLCRSKMEEGMGFREIAKLNEVLLTKQALHILTEEMLVGRLFRGKYKICAQNHTMEANPNSSPLWKRLCRVSRVVTENLCWRMWNGKKIHLNDNKWITPDYNNHGYEKLEDLIIPGAIGMLPK